MATAISDILLCPRLATNDYVRVASADLQVSWELSTPGALSCRVPVRDLQLAGLPVDLRGYWLRYSHPTAGDWGGVVMQTRYQAGVVEFAGASFAILARARLVTLKGVIDDVGVIFKKLLTLADSPPPATGLIVRDANIQLGGRQLGTNLDNADLLNDAIPLLTDQAGYEWNVDADRNVYFFARPDLRTAAPIASFSESVEITEVDWVDDVSTVFNDLIVTGQGFVSKTKHGNKSTSLHDLTLVPKTDQPSIDAYGRLQEKIDLTAVTTQGDLKAYAAVQIATLKDPSAAVTLTVADVNQAWANLREGTVIRVNLGLEGFRGNMLVESRALDVAGGTMTVAGSAIRVS